MKVLFFVLVVVCFVVAKDQGVRTSFPKGDPNVRFLISIFYAILSPWVGRSASGDEAESLWIITDLLPILALLSPLTKTSHLSFLLICVFNIYM